jgi:hypothetical protein
LALLSTSMSARPELPGRCFEAIEELRIDRHVGFVLTAWWFGSLFGGLVQAKSSVQLPIDIELTASADVLTYEENHDTLLVGEADQCAVASMEGNRANVLDDRAGQSIAGSSAALRCQPYDSLVVGSAGFAAEGID